jgi:tyrosine-protein phosphatase YwqE
MPWPFTKKIALRNLPLTCDIHTHILPGVDDGVRRAEDSLELLEQFARNGVSQVIFTPHVDQGMFPENTRSFLQERFNAFKKSLPSGLNINLRLAAEYMCDELLENANEPLLCMGDSSVLIEMSYYYISPYIKEVIFAFVNAGYKPILAHPERYVYLSRDLEIFDHFIEMGCSLQLNLLSLSGAYGPESQIILKHLLRNDMYGFTGTDVHSLRQYRLIREIEVDRSQAAKIEALMHNNTMLFPG